MAELVYQQVANDRTLEIGRQVDADRAEAAEATRRAGRLLAQLTRAGGADVEGTLLLTAGASGEEATSFLRRLGSLSKLFGHLVQPGAPKGHGGYRRRTLHFVLFFFLSSRQ